LFSESLDPDSITKKKEYNNFKIRVFFKQFCHNVQCRDVRNPDFCDECGLNFKEDIGLHKIINDIIKSRKENNQNTFEYGKN
jgi:hypothetical protein